MRVYSAAHVSKSLSYNTLIEGLRHAFSQSIQVPPRSMYPIDNPCGSQAVYGLMPAWIPGEILITKLATIFPDNPSRGLPTIHAQIIVFEGRTGTPIAFVDGTEVTRRRTAAASALAASYLAIEEAEHLVIVGTGAQALHQILAHAAIRPIRRIGVWGRSPRNAQAVVEAVQQSAPTLAAYVVDDLRDACAEADVISCVTSASDPVMFGDWLKPGAFLDLVGSHSPNRRECDDEAVCRSRIFVDTLTGALAEAGDLLIPLRQGVIRQSDIIGDLHALCRGAVTGRRTPEEITLFKSVGSAIEDLAASRMIVAEDLAKP